jgi:hypothetical protein
MLMNRILIAAIVAVLALAGCGPDDDIAGLAEPTGVPSTTEPPETSTPTPVPEPSAEPAPADDGPLDYKVLVEWEDASGLKMTLTGVTFLDRADYSEAWALDATKSEAKTVILIPGEIVNDTGISVEFYPGLGAFEAGTLTVGEDQYQGSFVSDLGGEIKNGATDTGTIVFESPRELDWFAGITEVRLIASAAWNSENGSADFLDSVTADVDLTIYLRERA